MLLTLLNFTRVPYLSNTRTGGAATQHFDSGGLCSAARSRGLSDPGRWTIQTRSNRSTVMPATWPIIQLFGKGLGHSASTWNCGTVLASSALARIGARPTARPTARLVASWEPRVIASSLVYHSGARRPAIAAAALNECPGSAAPWAHPVHPMPKVLSGGAFFAS